jgi:hypothetical protein
MVLREISLTLPNRPGALEGVARTLADHRINLAALGVDSSPKAGRARLIVSDPDAAVRLLSAAGYEPEIREMLAVRLEDRAGSFLRVLEVLAREKVNIQSVAILVAREGNRPLVALSSNDLPRARRLLQGAGFVSRAAEGLVSNGDLLAGSPVIPGESVGLLL